MQDCVSKIIKHARQFNVPIVIDGVCNHKCLYHTRDPAINDLVEYVSFHHTHSCYELVS